VNPLLEGPACRVRSSEGPACQVRLSEGPACRVRDVMFDYRSHFSGHDKHAPPISHSDSTFGGTRLSGPTHDVGLPISLRRARQACRSDPQANPTNVHFEGIQGLNRRKGSGSAKNRTIDTVRPCHVCDVLVSTVSRLYAHIPPLTPRGIGTLYLY